MSWEKSVRGEPMTGGVGMGQRSGSALQRILSSASSTSLLLFRAWSRESRQRKPHNPHPPPEELTEYLHDEVDVHGEGLNSVEAGDEGDGEEALGVHLPPQEEVPLQVVEAEVVFAAAADTQDGTHKTKGG